MEGPHAALTSVFVDASLDHVLLELDPIRPVLATFDIRYRPVWVVGQVGGGPQQALNGRQLVHVLAEHPDHVGVLAEMPAATGAFCANALGSKEPRLTAFSTSSMRESTVSVGSPVCSESATTFADRAGSMTMPAEPMTLKRWSTTPCAERPIESMSSEDRPGDCPGSGVGGGGGVGAGVGAGAGGTVPAWWPIVRDVRVREHFGGWACP